MDANDFVNFSSKTEIKSIAYLEQSIIFWFKIFLTFESKLWDINLIKTVYINYVVL